MIEVENLRKVYGDFTAVEGISFSVPEREVFGVVGPNGASKTTTLKMLARLVEPTSGTAQTHAMVGVYLVVSLAGVFALRRVVGDRGLGA